MISIASLIKNPNNFEFWLQYHISIGIEFFFLKIEETPELKSIIDKYSDRIYAEFHNEIFDKTNNAFTMADRQLEFVNKIIRLCENKNVRWLFHIDCDELIWVKGDSLKIFLDNIDSKYENVSICNFEAVFPSDDLLNPFVQTNKFIRCKNGRCLSYTNGKSATRITKTTQLTGPHHFNGNTFFASTNQSIILHFDSATYEIWRSKFSRNDRGLIDTNTKNYTQHWVINSQFFHKSIECVNHKSEDLARKYYNDMKVKPFHESNDLAILFWTPHLPQKNSNWS
jgi:hypothetical protein